MQNMKFTILILLMILFSCNKAAEKSPPTLTIGKFSKQQHQMQETTSAGGQGILMFYSSSLLSSSSHL
jgi:hypothetical protein